MLDGVAPSNDAPFLIQPGDEFSKHYPGKFQVTVTGDSMSPMILDRDTLIVSIAEPGSLTCGDIVVRWKQEFVSHRVITVNNNCIITKGDSRYWIDSNRQAGDIIGKVNGIVRADRCIIFDRFRWRLTNRIIGYIGWMQVKFAWDEQLSGRSLKSHEWMHRLSHWIFQRLHWVLLAIFAGSWMRTRSGLERND